MVDINTRKASASQLQMSSKFSNPQSEVDGCELACERSMSDRKIQLNSEQVLGSRDVALGTAHDRALHHNKHNMVVPMIEQASAKQVPFDDHRPADENQKEHSSRLFEIVHHSIHESRRQRADSETSLPMDHPDAVTDLIADEIRSVEMV
jgi:hypothetical protein